MLKNQSGFSHLILIIAIVVIAAIATVGISVTRAGSHKQSSVTSTQSTPASKSKLSVQPLASVDKSTAQATASPTPSPVASPSPVPIPTAKPSTVVVTATPRPTATPVAVTPAPNPVAPKFAFTKGGAGQSGNSYSMSATFNMAADGRCEYRVGTTVHGSDIAGSLYNTNGVATNCTINTMLTASDPSGTYYYDLMFTSTDGTKNAEVSDSFVVANKYNP